MRYSLARSDVKFRAASERDISQGVVYLYLWFEDRVDVHKLDSSAVDEYPGAAAELVPGRTPDYRITAGECSCPGYEFRESCRHLKFVKDWSKR